MRSRSLDVMVMMLVLAGCGPDLGVCEQSDALRLAYDDQGIPAFAGQALMIQSCGNGGFCHASGIEGWARAGAPEGLSYDVRPASTSARSMRLPAQEAMDIQRLEADRARALRTAGEIWGQVHGGLMPPWSWDEPPPGGPEGTAAAALRSAYDDATRPTYAIVANEEGTELEPLPRLDTEEGREILRNWLVCGAPVVERLDPRPPLPPEIRFEDEYFFTPACERDCAGITWPEIVDTILVPRCATSGCHAPNPDGTGSAAGQLDLSVDASSPSRYLDLHAELLGVAARGSSCDEGSAGAGAGLPLFAAGEPDRSLMLLKVELSSADVCGSQMPASGSLLSDQRLCVMREWIACGACPEPDGGDCATCLEERLAGCNLMAVGDDTCAESEACVARLTP